MKYDYNNIMLSVIIKFNISLIIVCIHLLVYNQDFKIIVSMHRTGLLFFNHHTTATHKYYSLT
jgi:hypothetical protein